MADILISDNGDGGDIVLREPIRFDGLTPETENADFYADTGIGTAVYVSLFDGDSWFEGLKTNSEKIPGLGGLQAELDKPITIGTLSAIELRANTQLSWMVADSVASSVTVDARNPAIGQVELDITIIEPDGTKNRYKALWDQQEQKLLGGFRAQPSVVEETL